MYFSTKGLITELPNPTQCLVVNKVEYIECTLLVHGVEIKGLIPSIFNYVTEGKMYQFINCKFFAKKNASNDLYLTISQVVKIKEEESTDEGTSFTVVLNGRLLFNDNMGVRIRNGRKRFDFIAASHGVGDSFVKVKISTWDAMADRLISEVPENSWLDFYGNLYKHEVSGKYYIVLKSYKLLKVGDGQKFKED